MEVFCRLGLMDHSTLCTKLIMPDMPAGAVIAPRGAYLRLRITFGYKSPHLTYGPG